MAVSEGEQHGKRGQTLHAWCPPGGRSINAGVGRVRCKIVRHTLGRSGRKGAFEFLSLIRKRNQTNQLQTKLLTSGPGGRRFKSSLPDQIFCNQSIAVFVRYAQKSCSTGPRPIFTGQQLFTINDLGIDMNP